jgi:hypothetical protein
MKAAAQQRWLLPHLLHAALDAATSSSSSSSSANDQAPANLPQLLSRLANTHGYSSAAELEQAVQQAFAAAADSSSGNGSGVLLSRQLQLLDTALFCLAHGLQVCPLVHVQGFHAPTAGPLHPPVLSPHTPCSAM